MRQQVWGRVPGNSHDDPRSKIAPRLTSRVPRNGLDAPRKDPTVPRSDEIAPRNIQVPV